MHVRFSALVLCSVLAMSCGATNGAGDRPITNPVEERTAVAAGPPATLAPGSLVVTPAAAGPSGASDAEGATVRAIEYLAELLAVAPRELRADGVSGASPRRVVVRDAFGNPHTVEVAESGPRWVGQTRDEGVLIGFDETQRLVVIQAQGRPLTLRLSKAGTGPSLAFRPGAPVAFAYDSSPRGDGVPVLAWMEPAR